MDDFFWLMSAGTTASDINFQAFLQDGLAQWNADRAAAAVTCTERTTDERLFSDNTMAAVNKLSVEVFVSAVQSSTQLHR